LTVREPTLGLFGLHQWLRRALAVLLGLKVVQWLVGVEGEEVRGLVTRVLSRGRDGLVKVLLKRQMLM